MQRASYSIYLHHESGNLYQMQQDKEQTMETPNTNQVSDGYLAGCLLQLHQFKGGYKLKCIEPV